MNLNWWFLENYILTTVLLFLIVEKNCLNIDNFKYGTPLVFNKDRNCYLTTHICRIFLIFERVSFRRIHTGQMYFRWNWRISLLKWKKYYIFQQNTDVSRAGKERVNRIKQMQKYNDFDRVCNFCFHSVSKFD